MAGEARFLLDTCALIWAGEDALSDEAAEALSRSAAAGVDIVVSPISAWELGLLMSLGRVTSALSPQRWFERALSAPGVKLAGLDADVLIESSFLPGRPPRDPADRIIIATARALGCTIVTRDRHLLAYAAEGHIQALSC